MKYFLLIYLFLPSFIFSCQDQNNFSGYEADSEPADSERTDSEPSISIWQQVTQGDPERERLCRELIAALRNASMQQQEQQQEQQQTDDDGYKTKD